MARWQDITIEKPKEKPKYKVKPNFSYSEYGFDCNNENYSLQEEKRDFRKNIQNEIIMEGIKTQNVLGNHITSETDRTIEEINENTDTRATEIKNKVDNHHNYVLNTVYPKIQEIDNEVDSVKTTVESNKTTINNIWDRVRSWI